MGSYNRAMDGARIKGYLERDIRRGISLFGNNLWGIIEKLAIMALAVFITCKISFVIGLIFAIPLAVAVLSSVIENLDFQTCKQVSKCINSTMKILLAEHY